MKEILIIFFAFVVACILLLGVSVLIENNMRQNDPERFIPIDFCKSQGFSYTGSIQNLSNEKYVLCGRYISGGMFSSGHEETGYFSQEEFNNWKSQGDTND